MALSSVSISDKINSVLIVSISDKGLMCPETWTIFSSSKHRTTCMIASVSLILAKNLLPKPSPLEAPATKPAISTSSTVAGWVFSGETMFSSFEIRWSGTSTMPTFGSIVQKG